MEAIRQTQIFLHFIYNLSCAPIGMVGVHMATGVSTSSAARDVQDVAVNFDAYSVLEVDADFNSGELRLMFNGAVVGTDQMSADNLYLGFGQAAIYENALSGTAAVGLHYGEYGVSFVDAPPPIPPGCGWARSIGSLA